MTVKLLTEHNLEFLSLKGGCTGLSESTLVKMPHCLKSHVMAQLLSFLLQDLLRTMPSNVCYCNIHSTGIPRLRRILRGLAWLFPDVGYCQGTGVVCIHSFKLFRIEYKNLSLV